MLADFVDMLARSMGVGYVVLVYGIGVLAMAFSVVAFQFKRRVTIILGNFLGQSCWVLYFLLQNDPMSAIACGLSAIMLALFAKKDTWRWTTGPVVMTVFILLFSGLTLLSFKTWSDVFPLLAGVFAVLANSRSSEQKLRLLSAFWCFFWLLNSVFKLYPVAFINDFLCTASAVVSLIRYRKREP